MTPVRSLEEALQEAFEQADSLAAPLTERLSFYLRRSRELLPELETEYDQVVHRIAASEAEKHLPSIGEEMPPFVHPDIEGNLVQLTALLHRAPVVISFNRGPWCEYCALQLNALARAYAEIAAAGGEVVSIVPEIAPYARKMQKLQGIPFRVLTDLDLGYALSLGLVFWIGETLKEIYRRIGIDLERFQGHGGWLLPIPATVVVGQDGRVKARFVDPDFRHRMNIEDIVSALTNESSARR